MRTPIRVPPWLERSGHRLLDALFPSTCLGCGVLACRDCRAPSSRTGITLGLCGVCRRQLVLHPGASCIRCARPFDGAMLPPTYICPACRRRPPPYRRLSIVWVYREPIDAVILGLKFGGLRYLARELGASLATRVTAAARLPEVVVPVPLHWRRQWARGYNQAEEIAASVAVALDRPLEARALRRRRATRPQMSLALEARRGNLLRAFASGRRARRIVGRRVLLVDDVVTSGATLGAAAACLARAGALEVTAAAVARAPEPGSELAGARGTPNGLLGSFRLI